MGDWDVRIIAIRTCGAGYLSRNLPVSMKNSVLVKINSSSARVLLLALAACWPVEDVRAPWVESARAPAGGPALGVQGTKVPSATVQHPATRRHRWQKAIRVLKIGLGGCPRPLPLKSPLANPARAWSSRPRALCQ